MRNVRAFLASRSFAASCVSGQRSPSAPNVWALLGPRIPHTSFRKRCVPVASCSVSLRSVASASTAMPKSVLSGSFEKMRRTVRMDTSQRLSGRFAALLPRSGPVAEVFHSALISPGVRRVASSQCSSTSWCSLQSAVSRVLRSAQTSAAPVVTKRSADKSAS